MTRSRESLIGDLVADLPRQRDRYVTLISAARWWLGAWLLVVGAALWEAPMREGVVAQFTLSVQFAVEMLLGLGACALLTVVAFAESSPHPPRNWLRPLAIGLTTLWVLWITIGLLAPALPPSMLGKREHCVWEVILYGSPALIAGLVMMRRGFVLNTQRAGVMLGIAAGAIPALLMQAACMYEPEHALSHHVAPVAVVALAGWLIGTWAPSSTARRYL